MKTTIEVYIHYTDYTWRVEVEGFDYYTEYDGTFSVNHSTGAIHLEWYQIPEDQEVWEDVEAEVRSIVAVH